MADSSIDDKAAIREAVDFDVNELENIARTVQLDMTSQVSPSKS
jgi:hypothetical protein